MIDRLSKEHFKAIQSQMEWHEEGKITLKSIPDFTDVPCSSVTMSKHFCNFKTYLSQCYGVEGFPLDYMVWLTLVVTS